MSRSRLNIYLERNHAQRLAALAAMKGKSKSAIIAAALASFLSPDSGDQREAAIAKRLDRLTHQFDKLERDQNILIETVAQYVRYALAVAVSTPELQHEAARTQGRERFQHFVEQLAEHLLAGNSLVKDIHVAIYPQQRDSLGAMDQDVFAQEAPQ